MSFNQHEVKEILKGYSPEKGNLMTVLHEVQSKCGNYLSENVLIFVSEETGVPLNQLYGHVSFYSMFSTEPRGKHIIRVCKDGPCNFSSDFFIADMLTKELGIGFGETTPDGMFTLEATACLGTCTAAPALMVDDEIYGNVTPERLSEILTTYRN